MSRAQAGDRISLSRRWWIGYLATAGLGLSMVFVSGCVSPASETSDVSLAAPPDGESWNDQDQLQRRADAELLATPEVRREVVLPPGLASAESVDIHAIRPLDLIVADHLNERHASVNQAEESDDPLNVGAVRNYVRGRALLVSGRPIEAIPFLESAIRSGGGTTGMRTLAEALDAAGRDSDALAIRRRLAVLGAASDDDLRRLVRELIRRRRWQEAIAVSAARVRRSLDAEDARMSGEAAVRLAESFDATGDSASAAEIRASLLSTASTDEGMLDGLSDVGLANFYLLAGDDAAKTGDAVAADARWRMAMELEVIDPAVLRPRLLWSSATLGRDATVQWLLLEAATAPSGGDLELAIILREEGLPMLSLCELLAARLRRDPQDVGAARLLVMLDPIQMTSVLNDGGTHRTSPEMRLSLVEASVAGGPLTAILVAAGVLDSADLLDPVIDRLIEGPWTDRELLETLVGEAILRSDVDTTLVRVEIFRRHDRSDLARSVLAQATLEVDDDLRRILAIRLAADQMDPTSVLAVANDPFDEWVEAERVVGLLTAGEPEIATECAERAVRRSPMSAELQAALGRSLSLVRGRELDAVEATARAIRLGDRRWSTRIELAKFMQRVRTELPADSEVNLSLIVIGEDPAFRRLIEADQAMANGDAATAERLLDGMLENSGAKDEVLVRMLRIWQSLGQRAKGRRRIDSLLARHPGDPALLDARFALRRAMGNDREFISELRAMAEESMSGLSNRRLESLLAETDVDRLELIDLVRVRLARRPDTPARAIDELELALLLGDFEVIDQAVRGCEVIEVATLTPRLRRRLTSVAAAVPNRRGAVVVERVAAWSAENAEPVSVDVAAAIVMTLFSTGEAGWAKGLTPAPAYSWLDSDWRSVGLSISEMNAEAGAELLTFALDSPDARSPANAGLLRSAIATGITAGWSARRIRDLLERQAADGVSPAEAFGMDRGDRLALAGASGDASLLGRRALAIELLEIAVVDEEADASTMNNLGFAMLEGDENSIQRATDLLESAHRQEPTSPSVLDSLGWLRYLEGRHDPEDVDGALLLISESIDRRLAAGLSVSGEVLLHFADAAWRAGRKSDAVNAWSRITEQALTRGDLAGRFAAYADYQTEIWGRVLILPEVMHERIDGRWIQQAELRLRAITEDRSPPVTPTFSERENVQNSTE
jgi:tetratricopeptide (TPR) repeat protein